MARAASPGSMQRAFYGNTITRTRIENDAEQSPQSPMSYILEALKKSQQERELGHVPRLQAITFDDRPAHVGTHRWVYAALLFALVAMAIALYAVLRTGQGPTGISPAAAPGGAAADFDPVLLSPSALSTGPRSLSEGVVAVNSTDALAPERRPSQPVLQPEPPKEYWPEPQPGRQLSSKLQSQTPLRAEPALPRPMASRPAPALERTPGLDAPESLSIQPEVLVVPAPPRPGQPLPRGADELRRAVLGDNASLSVDSLPPSEPARRPESSSLPDNVPVPKDLIADIEAFKREVGKGAPQTSEPQKSERKNLPKPVSAPRPAAEPDVALPPPASLTLRGKLPPFSMSVHIYDADPARRFIYINGLKLREKGQSREGIKVERIVADGAVLRYDGEAFFMPR